MATKMITRTIKVYTYTTGKLDFTTMKVKDVKNHSYPYKLGARAKSKMAMEDGNPIIAESSGEALYGMPIDVFMQYAKPITQEEAELAETADDE